MRTAAMRHICAVCSCRHISYITGSSLQDDKVFENNSATKASIEIGEWMHHSLLVVMTATNAYFTISHHRHISVCIVAMIKHQMSVPPMPPRCLTGVCADVSPASVLMLVMSCSRVPIGTGSSTGTEN